MFAWTDDFDEFCSLASKLASDSNGAPLFTVTHSRNMSKPVSQGDAFSDSGDGQEANSIAVIDTEVNSHEDEWQLL